MDQHHPSAADLSRVPLFAGLTDDARQVLASRLEIEEFDAGRRWSRRAGSATRSTSSPAAGSRCRTTGLRCTRWGRATLRRDRHPRGGAPTATVTAVEPVVAWSLFGTHFRGLQAERPDVADALEAAMRERLAQDTGAAGG